ncbi:TonB-dependent siderophore receptor [Ideonella sp.]|uniref:TonB-dependent siderophore receptor n=1 Tax=Ideonella sp. TaxID=1929293 RepID=UPI0035B204E8
MLPAPSHGVAVRHAVVGAWLTLPVLACAQAAPAAGAPGPVEAKRAALERIVVTGQAEQGDDGDAYRARGSSFATGLDLTLRETPQSISVVTRSLMDDFKLNSVNDVLSLSAGVVVEKVETDRTYYTARGFDIVNFQVDGIGIPMSYGLVDGDLDTAVYERVEVVRGAGGLLASTGNPSATINFVRKRPTAAFQASAGLLLGSWDQQRVDADVSGALNEVGSVRGRVVLAAEDKGSYLDRYHLKKAVFHGVVEADLGDNTLLTAGHAQQANRPKGNLWGALPLWTTDGTPTDYDTSTSTAPGWTYWNADIGQTFVELQHQLANGWQLRGALTHKSISSQGRLFYVYGEPDAVTGAGTQAWPSRYDMDNTQNIVDLRASGRFELWGRPQALVLGASASRSGLHEVSNHGQGIGTALPDLATWDGDFPVPVFDGGGGGASFVDRQQSLYAAARLRPADGLQFIVGANATWVDSQGESYGASRGKKENKATPYLGMVYDLTPTLSAYGSYTAIFLPQSEMGADFKRLATADGRNLELGLKAEWLDKKLLGTLALFTSRQNNLASFLRQAPDPDGHVVSVYEGVDTLSQGFELELAGALTPNLKISAGYTQLEIEDTDGEKARTFTPRQLLRLAGSWQALDALTLGATVAWQSVIYRDDVTALGTPVRTRQEAYALLDLMARYQFNPRWSATLNLENLTNQKHFTSLYWSQSYYGAPRSMSLSLDWAF